MPALRTEARVEVHSPLASGELRRIEWTAADRRVVEYVGTVKTLLKTLFSGGRDSLTRVDTRTITRLDRQLKWVVCGVDSSYQETSFAARRRLGRMLDSLSQGSGEPPDVLGEAESLGVRDEAGTIWVHLRRRPSSIHGAATQTPVSTTVEWWEARDLPGLGTWHRFEERNTSLVGSVVGGQQTDGDVLLGEDILDFCRPRSGFQRGLPMRVALSDSLPGGWTVSADDSSAAFAEELGVDISDRRVKLVQMEVLGHAVVDAPAATFEVPAGFKRKSSMAESLIEMARPERAPEAPVPVRKK